MNKEMINPNYFLERIKSGKHSCKIVFCRNNIPISEFKPHDKSYNFFEELNYLQSRIRLLIRINRKDLSDLASIKTKHFKMEVINGLINMSITMPDKTNKSFVYNGSIGMINYSLHFSGNKVPGKAPYVGRNKGKKRKEKKDMSIYLVKGNTGGLYHPFQGGR